MFDTDPGQRSFANSIGWITDTLLGEVAVTICVLAVALVGFSMLTGRISLRRGVRVILGCFVLLGAPVIAASLLGLWGPADTRLRPADRVVYEAQPRAELPSAESDNTRASLRRRSAD